VSFILTLFKPKIFDVLVEERRASVSRTFIVGFKSDRLTSLQKIEDTNRKHVRYLPLQASNFEFLCKHFLQTNFNHISDPMLLRKEKNQA